MKYMAKMCNIPPMVDEVLPNKGDMKSVDLIRYEHKHNYYTKRQIAGSFGGSLRWKTIDISANGIVTRIKDPVKKTFLINEVMPYGSPKIKLEELKDKLKKYGCKPKQIYGCLLGAQTNGLIDIEKDIVSRIA